ncbi:phosphate/phosphite/phosphonate ABC transporter substrate-binding protein [Paenibacillus periandrae]|uniref:phosphate/phosphite/phosphonate ABC transporter substrate-binding protein n=1 Tax=Paenibacillus periandrae TaxID=1761741 RepID=UPI001F0965C8|nr:phosphate/phosphite/phosphonate ABC transporter substrate-binding protein [Paenibacillus periandrae]
MFKKFIVPVILIVLVVSMAACSQSSQNGSEKNIDQTVNEPDTLTITWLPDQSGNELKETRDEIAKVIEKATGKKIENKLTTDIVVATEAVLSGNAQLGYIGPTAYVRAHNKNSKILPLVINTGDSGTISDAQYYCLMVVKKGTESHYKSGEEYTLDKIEGKKISYVSTSSTSGFAIPIALVTKEAKSTGKWKNIQLEDLTQSGKYFSEVLYGNTNLGALANMLSGKADLAVFPDTALQSYVDIVEGSVDKPGSIFRINDHAPETLSAFRGSEYVVISSTPMSNMGFSYNSSLISDQTVKKITAALTSDETAKNEKIFVPADSNVKGIFKNKTKDGKMRFIEIKDEWYGTVRGFMDYIPN